MQTWIYQVIPLLKRQSMTTDVFLFVCLFSKSRHKISFKNTRQFCGLMVSTETSAHVSSVKNYEQSHKVKLGLN